MKFRCLVRPFLGKTATSHGQARSELSTVPDAFQTGIECKNLVFHRWTLSTGRRTRKGQKSSLGTGAALPGAVSGADIPNHAVPPRFVRAAPRGTRVERPEKGRWSVGDPPPEDGGSGVVSSALPIRLPGGNLGSWNASVDSRALESASSAKRPPTEQVVRASARGAVGS